jgi:hypothetical protein
VKILRSVNRRGFSLAAAGYFTVLRPNTWFPASRLRDNIHRRAYPLGEIAGVSGRAASAPVLSIKLNANDPGFLRLAAIVLGATAITAALLWWICVPR